MTLIIELFDSITPQVANSIRGPKTAVESYHTHQQQKRNPDNDLKLSEPSSSIETSKYTSYKSRPEGVDDFDKIRIKQTNLRPISPITQIIEQFPIKEIDSSQSEKLAHCSFENDKYYIYCDVVRKLINVTDLYGEPTLNDLIHTIQYHGNDKLLHLDYLIKENIHLFQHMLKQIDLLHQQNPIKNYLHIKNAINSSIDSHLRPGYDESCTSRENTPNTINYTISQMHDDSSQIYLSFDNNEMTSKSIKNETILNCMDKNSSKCEVAPKLIKIMNEYDKHMKYEEKRDTLNINILSTLKLAIDYFHHALFYHSHENDIFEQIYKQITPCNISNCKIFERHYIDGSNCKIFNEYSILDKIHCYYAHSYDIGHRLTRKNQQYCNKCIATDNITNKAILRRKKIVYQKRQIYRKLNTYINDRKNRYTELNNQQNDNIYQFGWQFRYGGEEKEEKYEPDTFKNIHSKYSCLKEELTKNDIHRVDIIQFDNEYANAIINYNSRKRRQQYSRLDISHILAVVFYCNYDELQRKFSKTYRMECESQHPNFYHWGKLLKTAVHQHGTQIENSPYKHFYHGDDKKLLPAQIVGRKGIGVKIYCPLSTSTTLEVAINFTCQNNGLITEFGGKETKYFSCSWLSAYPSEHECLFIQNENTLQIVNIKDPETGCNYKLILDALEIIDEIVTDQFLEVNSISAKYSPAGDKFITKIIHDKLSTRLNGKYSQFHSLQPYARKLIHRYFENKKILKLNYWSIVKEYEFMADILFCNQSI
eukprot:183991_1